MDWSDIPKILYQDDHYVGIYKPPFLSSHPTRDRNRPSLVSWLRDHHPDLASATVAHRLDVETSGVILFAKTREARQCLDQLFKQQLIHKTYYGLVYGNGTFERRGRWQDYLKEFEDNKISHMDIVTKGGDAAITEYEVVETGVGVHLLRFQPKTGRKHQIRAQAAFHGFPLVGDELYGPFKKEHGLPTFRHWLHAAVLEFEDPLGQAPIKIESPVPSTLYALLRKGFHNKYLVLNKPHDVLSQFTGEKGERTIAEMGLPEDVWPVGRLDKKSEGLLLLTNDRQWRHYIMSPESNKSKIYWAQVDGLPSPDALHLLSSGPVLRGEQTKNCEVRLLDVEEVNSRVTTLYTTSPAVRERKNIPTAWLEIILREGKNHQVRRMTAAIGHPTLRLIRVGYGMFQPCDLLPGQWRALTPRELTLLIRKFSQN